MIEIITINTKLMLNIQHRSRYNKSNVTKNKANHDNFFASNLYTIYLDTKEMVIDTKDSSLYH